MSWLLVFESSNMNLKNKQMKTVLKFIAAMVALGFVSCNCNQSTCEKEFKGRADKKGVEHIRINQVGYMPKAQKIAYIVNSEATCFEVRNLEGKAVFQGDLEDLGLWSSSNEKLKKGDFSGFQTPGTYEVWVADKGLSYTFEITDDLYTQSLVKGLKTYYFQRASIEIEEKYAGIYKRPLGQPDTVVKYHISTGKDTTKFKDGSKGWYDAGDLNKYIVNAGVSVNMLYMMYENYPALFPDNQLNIPESGNGVSDLLDEIKYEMDWVLTMQDEDGGVFHKISELGWQWAVMPHQWNDKERFFIGKNTSSSLNLAAMCAYTYRIFKDIDPQYAAKNLDAAKKAWDWAMANPKILCLDAYGVGSGAYDDPDLKDEFLWAAAEMYVTTGEEQYKKVVDEYYFAPKFEVCAWRTFMSNLGLYSLLSKDSKLEDAKKEQLKKDFIVLADGMTDSSAVIPYGLPSTVFEWGSNSEMLNRTILTSIGYELTKDKKYLDATTRMMDYIMGTNAVGMTFVTGEGEYYPMRPHHRQCFADGIEEPIPGFLVGGPNFKREDDVDLHCPSCKTDYLREFPATSYVDHFHSYASNEVTINWNASYVYVLAAIQANKEALK
jgi:endoglucanase